jgi:DNA-binding NarL/FixJ family response regulator
MVWNAIGRETVTNTASTLDRARAAAAAGAWGAAHQLLTDSDATAPLGVGDLELLATACYMVGRDPDSVHAYERAHRIHLDEGRVLPAVRTAFWIGMNLALRGEWETASGWLGRAERLLGRHDGESAEAGYLLLPAVVQAEMGGDPDTAYELAGQAIDIGQRFDEADLVALGVFQQGRAAIVSGDLQAGLRLLDEAMVAVLADELSPFVTGIVYCGVIEGCYSVHALRRAHRWTEALTSWCERQPGMVAFTGQCLTHRAELLQLRGDWQGAFDEAREAGQRFHDGMNQYPAAHAHYRQGELHRLRGAFAEAETAYAAASRWGWSPQPGLALLRLAEGRTDAASAAITISVAAAPDDVHRARLLPAAVTIHLAAGDREAARHAMADLDDIASRFETETLTAMAAHARGTLLLAEGSPQEALAACLAAKAVWQQLGAPYEVSLARLDIARACLELGDTETAERESAEALAGFTELGAIPDAELARALTGGPTASPAGLSKREMEVLVLVAGGGTNRDIAAELVLSERTVDRHVSNILTKLGVSSRTAATAFAYENDLV